MGFTALYTTPYPQTVRALMPLVYCRMDSITATEFDASGNGATLTYSGSYTQGESGAISPDPDTAVLFSGGNVQGAGLTNLNVGTGDCSIGVWLKTSDTTHTQVAFGSGSIWAGTVNGHVAAGFGGTLVNSGVLLGSGWHHVAGVRKSGTVTVYLDGVLVYSATAANPCTDTHLVVGDLYGSIGAFQFAGYIDEGAMYGFALSAAQVQTLAIGTIAYNNPSIFWTGNNWYDSGTYKQANSAGPYFKTGFSGTSFALTVDCSTLVSASVPLSQYPVLRYTIDGNVYPPIQIQASGSVTLASGLTSGLHNIQCTYAANDPYTSGINAWGSSPSTGPSYVLRISGFTLDIGAQALPPSGSYAVKTRQLLVIGDSLAIGVYAHGNANQSSGDDATECYPIAFANLLNAEVAIIGYGGQGYVQAGLCSVPNAVTAFPNYDAIHARLSSGLFPQQPDVVLLVLGTNDAINSDTGVQAAIQTMLGYIRAAGPLAKILLCVQFGGFERSAIDAAFAAYQAAPDVNCGLIDLGLSAETGLTNPGNTYTPTPQASDGLHPYAGISLSLGTAYYGQAQARLDGDVSRTVAIASQTAPLVTGSIASATATTVTLDSNAPAVANQLIGYAIQVSGQPPANIIGYTASRVCTVGFGYPLKAWPSTPANGTAYTISGVPAAGLNSVTG